MKKSLVAPSHSGVLLMDALLALALLSMGLFASYEAFSMVQRTRKRTQVMNQLAVCAEEKLVELFDYPDLSSGPCRDGFQWRREEKRMDEKYNQVSWVVSSKDGIVHEERFETILERGT